MKTPICSQRYRADDGYEYCHIHADRRLQHDTSKLLTRLELTALGITLASDAWEHYTWHMPEPNIILLRRKLPTPAAPKSTREVCTQTENDVMRSEIGTQTDEDMWQAGGVAPPSAEQAGGVAPPSAEQAGGLTASTLIEEKFVAIGLFPSIFVAGLPGLTAFATLLESLWALVSGDARAQALACAVVFGRGVRGVGGLMWLKSVLLSPEALQTARRAASASELFDAWNRVIAKAWPEECKKRGGYKWAAHREGRHTGLSGVWFLAALADVRADRVARTAALRFHSVFEVIERCAGAALPEDALFKLLRAWRGAYLRCAECPPPGAKSNTQVATKTAGAYNAFDAGRAVWLWAAHTANIEASTLSEDAFAAVLLMQRAGPRKRALQLGIKSAALLEKQRRCLQVAAMSMPDARAPWSRGGIAPDAPWKREHLRMITWPQVFWHTCEFHQVVNAFSKSELRSLADCLDAAIAATLGELHAQPPKSNLCPAVATMKVALQHLQCSDAGVGCKRLRGKQPPVASKGKLHHGAGIKSVVRCPTCNGIVRRDNLARHQQGNACRNLKPRAKTSTFSRTELVTCDFSLRKYIVTQRARHLRTRACRNARARGSASIDID